MLGARSADFGSVDLFPRLEPAPLGEAIVNNPDQDFGTMFDISTQSETALAGFERAVVVAFNDSGPLWNPLAPLALTGYSRSTDGGNTFIDVGSLPPPPGGANFGDPGLAAGRNGFSLPPASCLRRVRSAPSTCRYL